MKIITVGDASQFNAKLHAACMQRLVSRWAGSQNTNFGEVPPVHSIGMLAPDRDGSQRWSVCINTDTDGNYVRGQTMVLGALLRTPDSEVEFHS